MAAAKSKAHAALGAAVRAERQARGLTLEELGHLVDGGMNPRYISACERGEINIAFANLLRLSAALGVQVAELVAGVDGDAGIKNPPPAAPARRRPEAS